MYFISAYRYIIVCSWPFKCLPKCYPRFCFWCSSGTSCIQEKMKLCFVVTVSTLRLEIKKRKCDHSPESDPATFVYVCVLDCLCWILWLMILLQYISTTKIHTLNILLSVLALRSKIDLNDYTYNVQINYEHWNVIFWIRVWIFQQR